MRADDKPVADKQRSLTATVSWSSGSTSFSMWLRVS
jgi:hypothetical protein